MQENETASTQPQSGAESQTTPAIPPASESGKQPETLPVTPAITPPVIPSGTGGTAKTAAAPKPSTAPKPPVTPAITAPTETVPEDKTFEHSMDKSESVTVKGKDLAKVYVIEKYLKTGQTTRVAEKMTGAVVVVHADEFESYMASLKKLGNIETKVLHKPE